MGLAEEIADLLHFPSRLGEKHPNPPEAKRQFNSIGKNITQTTGAYQHLGLDTRKDQELFDERVGFETYRFFWRDSQETDRHFYPNEAEKYAAAHGNIEVHFSSSDTSDLKTKKRAIGYAARALIQIALDDVQKQGEDQELFRRLDKCFRTPYSQVRLELDKPLYQPSSEALGEIEQKLLEFKDTIAQTKALQAA